MGNCDSEKTYGNKPFSKPSLRYTPNDTELKNKWMSTSTHPVQLNGV